MKNIIYLIYEKGTKIKHKEETAIISVLFLIGTFIFLLCSPLNPIVSGCSGADSSVFKTVALMMQKGFVPYKDTFDHKGPLIYILNYFGNQISYYSGVWVIEFVFLIIGFSAMYWLSRLFCNMWKSLLAFLLAAILMFIYFEQGNLTEEYAMTFIAISAYIFADYFKNGKVSKIRLVVCGICFAGTLMLRANMISLWCVMCMAVLTKSVTDNNKKDLIKFLCWFLAGVAIVVIPLIIWLWKNDALLYFWNDYIVFNRLYVSSDGGKATSLAKFLSYIHFAFNPLFLVVLLFQFYICFRERNIFNIAYLILMLVSPLSICVSGRQYGHYGMILVPLIVYPTALVLKSINLQRVQLETKKLFCTMAFALGMVFIFSLCTVLAHRLQTKYVDQLLGKNIPSDVKEICEILDEKKIGQNEAISVYGSWDIIYVLSKRPHATNYSYQFPIGEVMPSIMDDYMKQMQEELPKVVVVQRERYDDNIDEFLKTNNYELIWSSKHLVSYDIENQYNSALLYLK